MKLSSVLGVAGLIAVLSARPALCGKLEPPAFPILAGGAISEDVGYSSRPVTINAEQKYFGVGQIDFYSIHDGTETFDHAIVGDGKMRSFTTLLPDPGKYRVHSEGVDMIVVYDPKPPTSVIAPLIRRDCEAGQGALLITGTASSALAGVRKVEVAVDPDNGKKLWWSGADWTTTGTWLTASGKDPWEIRLPRQAEKGANGHIHVFASALSHSKSREAPHDAILQIPPECP